MNGCECFSCHADYPKPAPSPPAPQEPSALKRYTHHHLRRLEPEIGWGSFWHPVYSECPTRTAAAIASAAEQMEAAGDRPLADAVRRRAASTLVRVAQWALRGPTPPGIDRTLAGCAERLFPGILPPPKQRQTRVGERNGYEDKLIRSREVARQHERCKRRHQSGPRLAWTYAPCACAERKRPPLLWVEVNECIDCGRPVKCFTTTIAPD